MTDRIMMTLGLLALCLAVALSLQLNVGGGVDCEHPVYCIEQRAEPETREIVRIP